MIFDNEGIARMPSHIRPLKDTEYQYREDRDDIKQNKRKLRDSVRFKSDVRGNTKPPDNDDADPDKSDTDNVYNKSNSESVCDSSDEDESRPTRVESDTKGKNRHLHFLLGLRSYSDFST